MIILILRFIVGWAPSPLTFNVLIVSIAVFCLFISPSNKEMCMRNEH